MYQDPKIFVGSDYSSQKFPDQLHDHAMVWDNHDIHICPWFCSADLFFHTFGSTRERKILIQSLVKWVTACQQANIDLRSILVSGSFISEKPNPNDLDLFAIISCPLCDTGHFASHDKQKDCVHLTTRKPVQDKFNLDLTVVYQSNEFSAEILKSIAWAFYHCHPEAGRGTRGIIMLKPDDLLTLFSKET